MIQYKQLGYIGISTCDTAVWRTFAGQYLGMQNGGEFAYSRQLSLGCAGTQVPGVHVLGQHGRNCQQGRMLPVAMDKGPNFRVSEEISTIKPMNNTVPCTASVHATARSPPSVP